MTDTPPSKDSRAYWRTLALSALVAITPFSVALPSKMKALSMLALLIVGVTLIATSTETRQRYRVAAAIVVVCLLRFALAATNIAWHGLGWTELDLPAQTLMFLGIAGVFTAPLNWRFIWCGFAITAMVFGSACIVQHFFLGADRAYGLNGGPWSAIEFTMITLTMVLFSIIQLMAREPSMPERWLHAIAIGVGLYGALLTQSRGPLLAFLPALAIAMIVTVRRTGRLRQAITFVVILIAGASVATFSLHRELVDRFGQVQGEVATFSRDNAQGPVRERIEMWITAWQAFEEHPVMGVGLDKFGQYARDQIARGQVSPVIEKYDHPHNEYLEAAATGGVPSLILLLLLFALPAVYFARRTLQTDERRALIATAGLVLVVVYSLCALTDNVFYRAMPQSVFLFLMLGFALATAYPVRRIDTTATPA
ncbi:O-antigen ligase [Luteibacter rhizovicinus]|uniref:O-antigen ligase n=1 Tax=Luteibacter rhizovicinus TaxID=242606 RepID=A0A4R3YY86_9GAMM|nr:O-antigen ligase family protein [Luteibacter rhizovicinus]TCV96313.1 O-antigen ligase [Luteibacter rhizovicinus]